MNIYDELTGELLTSPDETKGYLYDGQRVARHVEETEVILENTVGPKSPNGLRHRVPAHDEYEACKFYHTYTEDELKEREKPTLQEQVDANAAAIEELALMLAGGDA